MRFLWPDMLWLLVLVPALAAGYLFVLARRKRQALRYSSLVLIRQALSPGQRWRRHVPPALFLAAVAAAMVAAARPSAVVTLPSQYMTLIMAMDVSRSMLATDVAPNRISSCGACSRRTRTGKRCATRTQFIDRSTYGTERGRLIRSRSRTPQPTLSTRPLIGRCRSIIE